MSSRLVYLVVWSNSDYKYEAIPFEGDDAVERAEAVALTRNVSEAPVLALCYAKVDYKKEIIKL